MQRTSKKVQRYAGKDIAVGEPFDVHPNHIRILIAIGSIEPAEGDYGYVVRPVVIQHPAEDVAVIKAVDAPAETEVIAPAPPPEVEKTAAIETVAPPTLPVQPVPATPVDQQAATTQPTAKTKAGQKKVKPSKKVG